MNDTHPSISIVELMRILIDEEEVPYDVAWKIVTKTFAYTNHTVLPEVLPLLMSTNPRLLRSGPSPCLRTFSPATSRSSTGSTSTSSTTSPSASLATWTAFAACPSSRVSWAVSQTDRLEGNPKYVRMANLAIVGSFKVNGVAELHSQLLQSTIFRDFVEYKGRDFFTNVTNGITPRRWLLQCNPRLAELITNTLGSEHWLVNLKQISQLLPMADNEEFRHAYRDIKIENKSRVGPA